MLFKWMQKPFSNDDLVGKSHSHSPFLFRPYFCSIYMNFISELRLIFFFVRVIAFGITQYRNLFCAHFSLSLLSQAQALRGMCTRLC